MFRKLLVKFTFDIVDVAEKVTSLGKDWHRPCLKCEKCKKTLASGSHAEHDGKPYCHNPCYSALFGAKVDIFAIFCQTLVLEEVEQKAMPTKCMGQKKIFCFSLYVVIPTACYFKTY
ncbi:CRIP2 [Bugula neritina]|uniref:CRIP2 n=1 Tax=Bugula neritina TaxID=10212 RepID=A0A7J7KR02_BUGNE|nr:CRIP2 [Bugula neritina]